MTLKQFLSPVVMDWLTNPENSSKNFDEWFVENEDLINESVKNNIDEINEYIERSRSKAKQSKLLIENADENHVNSDTETKENKDSNTIMTQVKLFITDYYELIEKEINQFLQENADSIKVIDIKHTTAVTTHADFCTCTAMIIYEIL